MAVLSAVPVAQATLEGKEVYKVLDHGVWNIREPGGPGFPYDYYLQNMADHGWVLKSVQPINKRLFRLHFERIGPPVISLPLPPAPVGPEVRDVYKVMDGINWMVQEPSGIRFSLEYYLEFMRLSGWILKEEKTISKDSLCTLHFEKGPVG